MYDSDDSKLKYRGPIPRKSSGGHDPSIWYISDEHRYEYSIWAIEQRGGFIPYKYCFGPDGDPYESCRYFSLARHDFRDTDTIMIRIGDKNYAFSKSSLRDKMTPGLNGLLEDFHMLCLDYYADFSNADDRTVQTLIFPTNRAFFMVDDDDLIIVGCYYGIQRDSDGNYSILINDELASGPYVADDNSGFDWLEKTAERNIGEWRRENGIY